MAPVTPPVGSTGHDRTTRRRPPWPVVGVLLVALAGLGAASVVLLGPALGGGGGGVPAAAMATPRFVDVAASAGIEHRYDGDFQFFVGGGVAAFDCDDDGRSDLYLAGGAEPASLYRNRSPVGGPIRFEPLTSPVTDLDAVTGAYPLDVDGDRHQDLAVLRVGENVLLRGLGDCRFERANEALGFDGGAAWTAAFSATWEGANPLPTLAFGNYLQPDAEGIPQRDTCEDGVLLRPDDSGERYGPPIALSPGYCALSVLFSDWDGSGRRDLRMTNDRHYYRDGSEQLWRIEPGESPRPYTEADGWRPMQIWGMGIASRDLTGDGLPEVFLTSQGDNKLQTLAAGSSQPTYEDVALARGATAHRPYAGGDVLPSTAWHPAFEDLNNDTFVDLFVTKGNVEAQPDYASKDPSDLLLGQPDGSFVEAGEAAGIVEFARGRGAAVVDLDLDGLLDIVTVKRRENVVLWRNVGAGDPERPSPIGHWAAVRLVQPAPNRDGIGAWLDVRIGDLVQSREVTVGGGHASGQAGWIHVGLGEAERAEVRVRWPDGEPGPWMTLPGDGFSIIERGATEVQGWVAE